jgi:multidrug efflux pump subunit AcrA (membrane-fusion protein)
MTLLVLEDDSTPEVRATLPSDLDVPLAAGGEARVRFSDGVQVDATLDRVEPSADLHTRVVYLSLPETGRPTGTFVQVGFPVPRGDSAIHVPEGSLIVRGPLRGVFVIEGDRAILRWLRLDENGHVLSGLSEGEAVVLSPSTELKDGSRVEVAS